MDQVLDTELLLVSQLVLVVEVTKPFLWHLVK